MSASWAVLFLLSLWLVSQASVALGPPMYHSQAQEKSGVVFSRFFGAEQLRRGTGSVFFEWVFKFFPGLCSTLLRLSSLLCPPKASSAAAKEVREEELIQSPFCLFLWPWGLNRFLALALFSRQLLVGSQDCIICGTLMKAFGSKVFEPV